MPHEMVFWFLRADKPEVNPDVRNGGVELGVGQEDKSGSGPGTRVSLELLLAEPAPGVGPLSRRRPLGHRSGLALRRLANDGSSA